MQNLQKHKSWLAWISLNLIVATTYSWFYLLPGVERVGGRAVELVSNLGAGLVMLSFVLVWLLLSGILLLGWNKYHVIVSNYLKKLANFFKSKQYWKYDLPAWGICLVGILFFTLLAYNRHLDFRTGLFDFALEHQVVWNTSRGRLFEASVEVNNYIGDHFSPIIALPAAIYAVLPGELTLFATQATAVMIAAFGIFYLAKYILKSRIGAYGFLALFLLYWGNYGLLMFDFHPVVFGLPLLVWGIYLLYVKKMFWRASLLLLLATFAKEDVGMFVGSIGVYWALVHKDKRGWLLAIYGYVISVLALLVIIPAVRGEAADTLMRYGIWGNSGGEIIKNILLNPFKVVQLFTDRMHLTYLVRLLLPLGLLSLWAPAIAATVLPNFIINMLSNYEAQLSLINHYDVMIMVGLFWAAMVGWARFTKWWSASFKVISVKPIGLFIGLLIMINLAVLISHPISRDLRAYPERRAAYAAVVQLRNEIADKALVRATQRVGAHFGDRRELQILDSQVKAYPNSRVPDWLLVDTIDGELPVWVETEVDYLLRANVYELVVDTPLIKGYRLVAKLNRL
jgi:uncharacterized membrane protein